MPRKIEIRFLDEAGVLIAIGLDYYIPQVGELIRIDDRISLYRVKKRFWIFNGGSFRSIEITCEPG